MQSVCHLCFSRKPKNQLKLDGQGEKQMSADQAQGSKPLTCQLPAFCNVVLMDCHIERHQWHQDVLVYQYRDETTNMTLHNTMFLCRLAWYDSIQKLKCMAYVSRASISEIGALSRFKAKALTAARSYFWHHESSLALQVCKTWPSHNCPQAAICRVQSN